MLNRCVREGGYDMSIEVRDLDDETMDVYLCCGTSPRKCVGKEVKLRWTRRMQDKGLGATIAYCDGWPAGFVNYMPVEVAPCPIKGTGSLFVMCIHVNDADDDRGVNHEGKGVGRALVAAVESHAKAGRFSGVTTLAKDEDHMPAAFWRKLGYDLVEQDGVVCLMCKHLVEDAQPPSLWRGDFMPSVQEDVVHVDVLYCSFCGFHTHIKKIASEYPKVAFHEHAVDDRQTMDIDCINGHISLFVDGKRGPNWPAGEEEWRRLIKEALLRKGLPIDRRLQPAATNGEDARAQP